VHRQIDSQSLKLVLSSDPDPPLHALSLSLSLPLSLSLSLPLSLSPSRTHTQTIDHKKRDRLRCSSGGAKRQLGIELALRIPVLWPIHFKWMLFCTSISKKLQYLVFRNTFCSPKLKGSLSFLRQSLVWNHWFVEFGCDQSPSENFKCALEPIARDPNRPYRYTSSRINDGHVPACAYDRSQYGRLRAYTPPRGVAAPLDGPLTPCTCRLAPPSPFSSNSTVDPSSPLRSLITTARRVDLISNLIAWNESRLARLNPRPQTFKKPDHCMVRSPSRVGMSMRCFLV
jgi:hypothetical protein